MDLPIPPLGKSTVSIARRIRIEEPVEACLPRGTCERREVFEFLPPWGYCLDLEQSRRLFAAFSSHLGAYKGKDGPREHRGRFMTAMSMVIKSSRNCLSEASSPRMSTKNLKRRVRYVIVVSRFKFAQIDFLLILQRLSNQFCQLR